MSQDEFLTLISIIKNSGSCLHLDDCDNCLIESRCAQMYLRSATIYKDEFQSQLVIFATERLLSEYSKEELMEILL